MGADSLFVVLTLAAVTIGSLHSLAPDHWIPFAALARAQGWSGARTARITALCGFGHVTASVLLGLLGLVFGVELLRAFGERMEALAGIVLIGFGLIYAAWSIRSIATARLHGHSRQNPEAGIANHDHPPVHYHHHHVHGHHHYFDHEHDGHRLTAWTLFLLFSAAPCVAVVPLMFAAAPLGFTRTLAVVCAYEAATIGTMVALVMPARLFARRIRGAWIEGFGDVAAGAVIAGVGLAVAALGW